MKILVGSTNPVKIAATRAVFKKFAPNASVKGIQVDSGVPSQPWGNAQTRKGALNRAHAALQANAAYGIGFEGGLIETEMGLMTTAWCAVVGASGTESMGGSVNILLPKAVAEAVYGGKELGPAMDQLTGKQDTKQGPGAVGILTDGQINRQTSYEHCLLLALAPFYRRDLYTDPYCES